MKIICIGRNYADHVRELDNKIPESPVIFLKPKSALVHKGKALMHPYHTIDWQYEAEIVIKISKNGKSIAAEDAREYYNEYTIGLDMTCRDLQQKLKSKGLPWELAKAHDGSAVVGDFLPLFDDVDIQNLQFQLLKNDEIVQNGNTTDMIYGVNYLIEYISQYFIEILNRTLQRF